MPAKLPHEPYEAAGAELPAASLHRDALLNAMVAGCLPDAPASDAFREVTERLRAGVPFQPTGDPDHDFVHGATATLRDAVELAQYVLHHGHDPELRRLARSAIAENQKQLARLSRWQARHGEKHVQQRRGFSRAASRSRPIPPACRVNKPGWEQHSREDMR